jgi:hypothetical protein
VSASIARLTHLHFAEGNPVTGKLSRYDAATGTLVRLGGRGFVFTAWLYLDGERRISKGSEAPRALVARGCNSTFLASNFKRLKTYGSPSRRPS